MSPDTITERVTQEWRTVTQKLSRHDRGGFTEASKHAGPLIVAWAVIYAATLIVDEMKNGRQP